MRTADFHFELPEDLIAQTPAERRDRSRLLVMDRRAGKLIHRSFTDIASFLQPSDALILNNSKVIAARLRGVKVGTAGKVEMLLVEELEANDWWVLLRPGKRVRTGTRIQLLRQGEPAPLYATVTEKNPEGHCRVRFEGTPNILGDLSALGEIPLPPYITRNASPSDLDRYQTIYAEQEGSVAAPTAGLHFTEESLNRIRASGVSIGYVTLHVGLGTFAPVKAETLSGHTMHEERFWLPPETADLLNQTRARGGRIVAVGTTTVRVLESVAATGPIPLRASSGRTRIFIFPPYRFQLVDALLTNFHLPQSTLLMLVSAFAAPGETRGRETVLAAYAEAVRERYRFFSYGDAMMIL